MINEFLHHTFDAIRMRIHYENENGAIGERICARYSSQLGHLCQVLMSGIILMVSEATSVGGIHACQCDAMFSEGEAPRRLESRL